MKAFSHETKDSLVTSEKEIRTHRDKTPARGFDWSICCLILIMFNPHPLSTIPMHFLFQNLFKCNRRPSHRLEAAFAFDNYISILCDQSKINIFLESKQSAFFHTWLHSRQMNRSFPLVKQLWMLPWTATSYVHINFRNKSWEYFFVSWNFIFICLLGLPLALTQGLIG